MLRIDLSKTVKVGLNCLFQGELFTGVGYKLEDSKVVDTIVYRDGKPTADVDTEFAKLLGDSAGGIWEEYDVLREDEYGLAQMERIEERFNGLFYRFENGFCIICDEYIDGELQNEVEWNEKGELLFYSIVHHGIVEQYSINRPRTQWDYELHITGVGDALCLKAKNNTLNSIMMREVSYDSFKKYSSMTLLNDAVLGETRIPIKSGFGEILFFSCFNFSEKFYIVGEFIDDDFLKSLSTLDNFKKIKELNLWDITAVSADLLNKISQEHNISINILD